MILQRDVVDRPGGVEEPADVSHALPWRSRTAWLLSLFLVAQSWQFYSALAWVAPTYESHGWSARDAGLLMAVFTGTQFVSGLLAPTLLDRVRDGRSLLVAATAVGGVATAGIWLLPDTAPWLWAALLGTGQGACFALALGHIVRFAGDRKHPDDLAAEAVDILQKILTGGPLADASRKAIDDLLDSL